MGIHHPIYQEKYTRLQKLENIKVGITRFSPFVDVALEGLRHDITPHQRILYARRTASRGKYEDIQAALKFEREATAACHHPFRGQRIHSEAETTILSGLDKRIQNMKNSLKIRELLLPVGAVSFAAIGGTLCGLSGSIAFAAIYLVSHLLLSKRTTAELELLSFEMGSSCVGIVEHDKIEKR